VRVDHTDFADSRWYPGSGINRNVYLIATNPIHIGVWGTAFSTPTVSTNASTAQVNIRVENQGTTTAPIRVVSTLRDAAGKVVAEAETQAQPAAGQSATVQNTLTLKTTTLWSVDNPYRYTLETTLYAGKQRLDQTQEKVGFRTFRFDVNEGFTLNGQSLKLKGLCIHDDAGALGSAVPRDVWARRLKAFKDLGCNSIRMSHNPHQDYLYDLCDELGLLVQDEAFDEWEQGKNKWIQGWNIGTPGKDGYHTYFNEWADRDVRDMILRNYNHPSIIMWSIGNEIDYPNDPYTHEVLNTGRNPQIYGRGYQPGNPAAARLGEIATRLVRVVKQYDTTRPVTAALAGVVMSNYTDFPGALDLVGYNYQEYRYRDDHAQYPKRIIYGSENSRSYNAWVAVDTSRFISGQYLWTGIDFMGEAHVWPERSSGAGLLDLAGFEKPEYQYRRSFWSAAPTLTVVARPLPGADKRQQWSGQVQAHWNWKAGDSLEVFALTNADEVELFLNNTSLGRRTRRAARQQLLAWNIAYQPGTIRAEAYTGGRRSGSYTLTTSGNATTLQATSDRTTLPATVDAVAHITVQALDGANVPAWTADQDVTVTLEGPGKLIGLESGDLSSHEDYKASHRKLYHGKLLAYIQATGPGTIRVTLSAPGLKSTTVTLKATK